MARGSFAPGRIVDAIQRSDDAFGRRTAQGTRNQLDIASQYRFTPERLRIFRNGTRLYPQYDTLTRFEDTADTWNLQPDAGDAMHIETAESITYIVNYEIVASWAFELNQELQSGDVFRVGPYNGTDGWVLEQRGSDHGPLQADIIEYRQGTRTTLKSDIDLEKPFTDWTRLECDFNWYGVGNQVWKQTYTINGSQFNDTVAKSSNDGQRGPDTGNLNLWYEVEAGSGTSNLELHGGSMGAIIHGDPTSLNRNKPQYESITVNGTANAWEPIFAIRVDPNDDNVNSQFAKLQILNYGANADIELVAASFTAEKTNATGWGVPGYHHVENSSIQSTTNVSQVADDAGVVQDLGTDDKFGGFTVAASVEIDGAGGSSETATTVNANRQEKKSLLASDHIVIMARTGTTGSVLDFIWDVDQNW